MSDNSAIEWTDCTWNPIAGCTPVSPGCLHCYAATMAHRLQEMGHAKYKGLTVLHSGVRSFNGAIRLDWDAIEKPLEWKKGRKIFVNSMSDLFHEKVEFDFVDKLFAVMALCPQHTFQVLTKRPERMAKYFNECIPLCTREEMVAAMKPHELNGKPFAWGETHVNKRFVDKYERRKWPGWPLKNVWLGTSVENQKTADERIPHLLKCPAKVRFLSCEPLLGPVDLDDFLFCDECRGGKWGDGAIDDPLSLAAGGTPFCEHGCSGIGWVIVGGESGAGARPCKIEWIRDIVDQCKDAGVPVFHKQLGSRPVIEPAEVGAWLNYPNYKHAIEADGMIRLVLNDRKGGDPSEWPEDLRVRQMLEVRS